MNKNNSKNGSLPVDNIKEGIQNGTIIKYFILLLILSFMQIIIKRILIIVDCFRIFAEKQVK